jgi:kinetochore protein NDC80
VVKPGLERLCEMYRTRASELSQDLISLREACVARAERNSEKKEENAALEGEVGAVALRQRQANSWRWFIFGRTA